MTKRENFHSQPESTGTSGGEGGGAQERWDLGPWENGYRQIWTPGGGFFQARVVAHVFGGDLRRERLIAAAPDYAAAAEQMLSHEDAGGDGWWKGFEMLKAAHAKALGADPKAGA